MRALTVRQPYASLIMAGLKTVENRRWPVPKTLPCHCLDLWCDRPRGGEHTPFPFRLWVHAGKAVDFDALSFCGTEDGYDGYDLPNEAGTVTYHPQSRGWGLHLAPEYDLQPMPLGVLLGSVLVTGCHGDGDCLRFTGLCSPWAERGAYHWTLTDPQPLPEPIPMKGRQGLWTVPDDVAVPA